MQQYPPQGGYVPTGQAYQPPQGQPPTATQPKKKRGCIIALVVTVLLLCCCCGGSVGGAMLVARSAGEPRDLGVTVTEADFDSAVTKLGITDFPKDPPGGDWDNYERVYTGSKPMDATLTQSEISALMSYNHGSGYWPVTDVQVKLLGGDKAEMSCLVSYQGTDWPVYASGAGSVSGKSLSASIASAEVAGVEVPPQYLPQGSDLLSSMVTKRLQRIDGLNIESVEVQGDQVHVVGTVWEKAEWVEK